MKKKIIIHNKDGQTFEGTPLECAEEMEPDAAKSRIAVEECGYFTPLPPHWLFEDFCKENGIKFTWYRSNSFERGFYVLSSDE